jgi:hypothetical protein
MHGPRLLARDHPGRVAYGRALRPRPELPVVCDAWCPVNKNESVTDGLDEFRRVFAEHDLGFSDALALLSSHFRQAMQAPGESVVVYSHDGQPALILGFNRKGEFAGLDVGRALHDADLASLTTAFTAPRPRHVMAVVIFSSVPTTGFWRYRDLFQVFPMPPEAPRPPYVFGGVHPLMLEVAYDGSHIDSVDEYRGAVATREVNRLLSGVLRGTEDRLGHFARSDWFVVPETDDDGIDRLVSDFGQVGYFLGGEHATRGVAFGGVADDAPKLELSTKDEYYARRGISDSDVLVLPESFEASLDRYFGLRPSEQDKALRWCHWLNHARQVAPLSPSASAIAAVQAVEAVLPPAPVTGRCENCERSISPSVRQRFRHFLEAYSPGEANAAARDQLYELRSKLTHGGTLLTGELRHIAFRDFVPRSWDEREVAEQSLMLARIAGVNWLLDPASAVSSGA